MWEGVNCFLDLILSCSNDMLQWYWGLWLIGTVSLKVTPPWEIWKKLIHLKSGTVNFLMVFFFSNCYIQREKERQFSTYFSVVSSTVKIPKFCVSICHTLRGPGGLALGGECSPFPSAVSLRSCFPPLPHPTQLYLQLRHLPAGCCAKMPWWTRAPQCCPRSRGDLLKDIVFKNSQCSAFWWI